MAASLRDVLIVGGGPAGLTAALAFGRLGRSVTLFDSQVYRNAQSLSAHNLPGNEGIDPPAWRRKVREELALYASHVQLVDGVVTELAHAEQGFRAEAGKLGSWKGRKVLLATGTEDILPTIDGFRDLWGTKIIHCVFCHGYEHKGEKLAVVLSTSPVSNMITVKTLLLKFIPRLVESGTILLNGLSIDDPKSGISLAFKELINTHRIQVLPSTIQSIATSSDTKGVLVTFSNKETATFDVLLHSPLPGIAASLSTLIAGVGVKTCLSKDIWPCIETLDTAGRTTIKGIWAAGNAANPKMAILASQNSGFNAAAAIIDELSSEE